MDLICSCFGLCNRANEPNRSLENVINKWKSLFHRSQVEAVTVARNPLTDDDINSDSQQNIHIEVFKPPNKALMQTKDYLSPLHQKVVVQVKPTEENKSVFPCSDDEDVCPTCLEEYDEENPKITTQCNHHYHLACIYEWMERSPSCPVCSEVILFQQTNQI